MPTYPPGVATPAKLRHAVRTGDVSTVREIAEKRGDRIAGLYTPGLLAEAVKSGRMGMLEWAVYRFVVARRVPREILAALLTAAQPAPSLFTDPRESPCQFAYMPAANDTTFGGAFDFAAWRIRRADAAAPPADRVLGVQTAAEITAGAPNWEREIAGAWSAADSMAWQNRSHSVRVHAWLEALFDGDTRFGGARW